MVHPQDRHPILGAWEDVHAMVAAAGRQLDADHAVLVALLPAAQAAAAGRAPRTLLSLKADSRLHGVVANGFAARLKDLTERFEAALARAQKSLDAHERRMLADRRALTARLVARALECAAANRRLQADIEAVTLMPL